MGRNNYYGNHFSDYEDERIERIQKENDAKYTQEWLRSLIGKRVKIEFLLGTNMLIDREGTLLQVGISYVVIKETSTGNDVMCDIYSIKFINIFN